MKRVVTGHKEGKSVFVEMVSQIVWYVRQEWSGVKCGQRTPIPECLFR